MFKCLSLWRTPPEPTEAREAARRAVEQRARLNDLTEYLAQQRQDNHFADRLSEAFTANLRSEKRNVAPTAT